MFDASGATHRDKSWQTAKTATNALRKGIAHLNRSVTLRA
jgi:hypothetical protein